MRRSPGEVATATPDDTAGARVRLTRIGRTLLGVGGGHGGLSEGTGRLGNSTKHATRSGGTLLAIGSDPQFEQPMPNVPAPPRRDDLHPTDPRSGDARLPSTTVIVCTWRGTAHLRAQLDSIAAQSAPCTVEVHDDASGDGTAALARAHPAVDTVVEHADNVGHVGNFGRALAHALRRPGCTHVAFADQDDVWRPARLAHGLATMHALERHHAPDTPLLVHSDLAMIDAAGEPLAPSFLRWRRYAVDGTRDVPRMLGQCGVMGNTCLVNRALAELALPFPSALHVHDWWLGLLAELHGVRAFLDEPLVEYRIHAANASNSIDSIGVARRSTFGRLLAREFRLPFRGDTRLAVLDALAEGRDPRPMPSAEDARAIGRFRRVLRDEGPRAVRAWHLARGGYVHPGRRYRLRVAAEVLLGARYGGGDRG